MKIQNIAGVQKNTNKQTDYKSLSDSRLYSICKEYGHKTLINRRKFAGTLPEVNRRKLYKRRSYTSIYEFAAKLAGMSRASVDRVLNLSEKLKNAPTLKEQLESGSQGWSKIRVVASIATPETDKNLAQKVADLSKSALEICVKEIKKESEQSDFTKTKNEALFVPGDKIEPEKSPEKPSLSTLSFKVDSKLEQKFRLFKQQLEKERKETLAFSEVLEALLDKTDNGQKPKEKITVQVCPDCAKKKAKKITKSRHIPIDVRRIIQAKYKGFCAFPGCHRPATSLHHCNRFALKPNHENIVPVCDAHENLLHAGLIANEEKPPEMWEILEKPDLADPKFHIDQVVTRQRYKQCNAK